MWGLEKGVSPGVQRGLRGCACVRIQRDPGPGKGAGLWAAPVALSQVPGSVVFACQLEV